MRGTSLPLIVLLCLAVLGEAFMHRPATATAAVIRPSAGRAHIQPSLDAGIATYYGADFAGQPMADGRLFDADDPTIAASNRWPLGTRLRLRRLPGGPWDGTLSPSEHSRYFQRSIVVTVEDHGNFTHALDLSRGAFARLGRPDEGVIRVQIEVVGEDAAPLARANASGRVSGR